MMNTSQIQYSLCNSHKSVRLPVFIFKKCGNNIPIMDGHLCLYISAIYMQYLHLWNDDRKYLIHVTSFRGFESYSVYFSYWLYRLGWETWLQKMHMIAIYLKDLGKKKHTEKSKLSIIKCSSMSTRLVVPQGDPSSGKGKYLWMSFESRDLFIKEKYSFWCHLKMNAYFNVSSNNVSYGPSNNS